MYNIELSHLSRNNINFLIAIAILVFLLFVICAIGNWKMYKKAGKKGWECIVPIYGYWVLVEIAEVNWWWFFIIIMSSINFRFSNPNLEYTVAIIFFFAKIIATFVCYYNISKKLNKEAGFAILMTLFPFIMLPLVGFSKKYQFNNSVKITPNGPFDANKA